MTSRPLSNQSLFEAVAELTKRYIADLSTLCRENGVEIEHGLTESLQKTTTATARQLRTEASNEGDADSSREAAASLLNLTGKLVARGRISGTLRNDALNILTLR